MARARTLTINAGSSSLKFALFDDATPPARFFSDAVTHIGLTAGAQEKAFDAALRKLEPFGGLPSVSAVGHRIVHGGPRFASSQIITADLLIELKRLRDLDPDHLPAELAIVEACKVRAPSLPQVACFDTGFHRTIPRAGRILPIPRQYEAEGLQRYGFHGLSYTYLLEALARVAGEQAASGRLVMAHLGSGSSLAAVHQRRCVDTTMAFTPNSGVPMGTRSGDLDPGVLIYLLRKGSVDVEGLDDLLSRRSGLLGISETSSDMRDLLERRKSDPRADEAVAVFCHSVRKAIGALTATLGGLDTLIFSGGIGENAPPVRAEICSTLAHLGIDLDDGRNASGEAIISRTSSSCTVRVIATDEESVIARETLHAIASAA